MNLQTKIIGILKGVFGISITGLTLTLGTASMTVSIPGTFSPTNIGLGATGVLSWNSETGLADSSAGVLELNNGTKGVAAAAPGITIPAPAAGAGSTFTLTGSAAFAGSAGAGGGLTFRPGAGDGIGSAGNFSFPGVNGGSTVSGGTAGDGSSCTFTLGNGGASTGTSFAGAGGSLTLTCGNGGSAASPSTGRGGNGGGVFWNLGSGGQSNSSIAKAGGGFTITGAVGGANVNSAAGNGSGVTCTLGAGGNTTGNGTAGNGGVYLVTLAAGGTSSGGGTAGVKSQFKVQDGSSNNYLVIRPDTAVDNTVDITLGNAGLSYASAAGSTHSLTQCSAYTLTLTGGTGVTALGGLSCLVSSPTVTSASATTVTTASALQVNGPLPAGSVTFTNSVALDVPTYATNGTTAAGIRCVVPSGATNKYALLVGSPVVQDSAADVMFATSAANKKAVVIQANTVNSGNNFEVQDPSGNACLSAIVFGTNRAALQLGTPGSAVGVYLDQATGVNLVSTCTYGWSNNSTTITSAIDTGLNRVAANVVGSSGGSPGWLQNSAGGLALVSNFTDTTGTLNATNFSFPVINGRRYKISGYIAGNNTTGTEGFQMDFGGGAATASSFLVDIESLGLGTVVLGNAQASTLTTALTATTFVNGRLRVTGYLVASATGTIIVRMAEVSHAAGTLTVNAGTWINLEDMRAV